MTTLESNSVAAAAFIPNSDFLRVINSRVTMKNSLLESSLQVKFQVKPHSIKQKDYPEILKILKEILTYSQKIEAYSPSSNVDILIVKS